MHISEFQQFSLPAFYEIESGVCNVTLVVISPDNTVARVTLYRSAARKTPGAEYRRLYRVSIANYGVHTFDWRQAVCP